MQHCNFCGNIAVFVVVVNNNNNRRPTLIVTYQKNNTYNSHCSHQSTDSVAFSLTEVWYFSLPKAIVTKASFVPERKKSNNLVMDDERLKKNIYSHRRTVLKNLTKSAIWGEGNLKINVFWNFFQSVQPTMS